MAMGQRVCLLLRYKRAYRRRADLYKLKQALASLAQQRSLSCVGRKRTLSQLKEMGSQI